MMARPVGGSKRGLWIALAAVVVVGGIAIAVAVGASSDEGAGAGAQAAGTASAPAAPGPTAPAAPGPTAPVAPGTGEAPADLDHRLARLDHDIDKLGHATDKIVDHQVANARAQVAAAEKQLAGLGAPHTAPAAARTPAAAKTPDDDDGPTPAAADDDYTGGPVAPRGGFDPHHFDVSGFYPQAAAEARQDLPRRQAVAHRRRGRRARRQGRHHPVRRLLGPLPVHLAVEEQAPGRRAARGQGRSEVRRLRQRRQGRHPQLRVVVGLQEGAHDPAAEVQRGPGVAKAIKLGAPGSNAVGELGYRSDFGGHIHWYFNVADAFSEMLPDNC